MPAAGSVVEAPNWLADDGSAFYPRKGMLRGFRGSLEHAPGPSPDVTLEAVWPAQEGGGGGHP